MKQTTWALTGQAVWDGFFCCSDSWVSQCIILLSLHRNTSVYYLHFTKKTFIIRSWEGCVSVCPNALTTKVVCKSYPPFNMKREKSFCKTSCKTRFLCLVIKGAFCVPVCFCRTKWTSLHFVTLPLGGNIGPISLKPSRGYLVGLANRLLFPDCTSVFAEA